MQEQLSVKYPTQWWHFNNTNWTETSFTKYLDLWASQFDCKTWEELEAYSSKVCVHCATETLALTKVVDENLNTPIMVCSDCRK
jgi:hypothetical protein